RDGLRKATRRKSRHPSLAVSGPRGRVPTNIASLDAFRGARVIFFGGKGGVGKTTAAAAVALRLAEAEPSTQVLLLSTATAPALADVFGQAAGDEPPRVPGAPENLRIRELDAAAAFSRRRSEFQSAFDEIAATVGANDVVMSGESGTGELFDLAPPGI